MEPIPEPAEEKVPTNEDGMEPIPEPVEEKMPTNEDGMEPPREVNANGTTFTVGGTETENLDRLSDGGMPPRADAPLPEATLVVTLEPYPVGKVTGFIVRKPIIVMVSIFLLCIVLLTIGSMVGGGDFGWVGTVSDTK
jgi:hypothetical protein